MEALIIVAHGSKIKSSNDEIIEISNKIKNKNENTFYAFLELSEPSFYYVLKEVVEKKYIKIKIFPYFLAAGKHVLVDIPDIIKEFENNYNNIEFTLLPHLGQCKGIEDLIILNS